jgi:hypothetical protein
MSVPNKPQASEKAGAESSDAQRSLHLFLYADAPATMAIQSEGLGHQSGRVLYHIHLHRPEPNP